MRIHRKRVNCTREPRRVNVINKRPRLLTITPRFPFRSRSRKQLPFTFRPCCIRPLFFLMSRNTTLFAVFKGHVGARREDLTVAEMEFHWRIHRRGCAVLLRKALNLETMTLRIIHDARCSLKNSPQRERVPNFFLHLAPTASSFLHKSGRNGSPTSLVHEQKKNLQMY